MPFYRKSDPQHGLCMEGLKSGWSFVWIDLSLGRDMSKGTKPACSTAPRTHRHLAEKEESGVTWLMVTAFPFLAATTNALPSSSVSTWGGAAKANQSRVMAPLLLCILWWRSYIFRYTMQFDRSGLFVHQISLEVVLLYKYIKNQHQHATCCGLGLWPEASRVLRRPFR